MPRDHQQGGLQTASSWVLLPLHWGTSPPVKRGRGLQRQPLLTSRRNSTKVSAENSPSYSMTSSSLNTYTLSSSVSPAGEAKEGSPRGCLWTFEHEDWQPGSGPGWTSIPRVGSFAFHLVLFGQPGLRRADFCPGASRLDCKLWGAQTYSSRAPQKSLRRKRALNEARTRQFSLPPGGLRRSLCFHQQKRFLGGP